MDLSERNERLAVRHPWEMARVRHVTALLQDTICLRGATVLDVGAGDGFVAEHLPRVGAERIVCWDINYDAADLGRADGRVLRTAAQPAGTYDVICALDVIEHVQDDVGLLRRLRDEHARPGTVAVVTVPAHQRLYGPHDLALGHYRRYSRSQLESVLELAGWQVAQCGGFFTILLVPRCIQLLSAERHRYSDAPANLGGWDKSEAVTRVIAGVLRADAAVGRAAARRRRGGIPGLSLFATVVAT